MPASDRAGARAGRDRLGRRASNALAGPGPAAGAATGAAERPWRGDNDVFSCVLGSQQPKTGQVRVANEMALAGQAETLVHPMQ